jgi:hypothetical protein
MGMLSSEVKLGEAATTPRTVSGIGHLSAREPGRTPGKLCPTSTNRGVQSRAPQDLRGMIDELLQTLDGMELALERLEEKVNEMEGRMKCGRQLCLMKMASEAKLCGKK